MARWPVALDSPTSPLARFAEDLRALRDRLGSSAPSVDEVSTQENIPRSTLYAALRGERLPSRRVVSALARSWGGAEEEWLAKRREVEAALMRASNRGGRSEWRERLAKLGMDGRQLREQVVADLMLRGIRPREAWRLAHELTHEEVAARLNQIRSDPGNRMRGSRICEYEKWPMGGVRPSVSALKILADIYETTWDRLVDVDDLEEMPVQDRQVFLDICEVDDRDRLESPVLQRRERRLSASRDSDSSQVNPPVTARESMTAPEWLVPGEITHFTGRDVQMAHLRAQISEQTPENTAVTLYAIDGMAGVGKTAFARHVARELGAHYPDGAMWVDLYGHTPGMQPREPSDALEQMLLQVGVPPEAMPTSLVERQVLWRYHMHKRQMLIVLDNARTSEQVLPLLPETPGSMVLVTSRRKLSGLTDAHPLSLDVLDWDEAEWLFIKLVGEHRCKDRAPVRQILAMCGRLPLAIRLIAGWLRYHPDELLAEIAAELSDQTRALDAFAADIDSVRAAFERSYQLLDDEQRRVFRLLGWHPGPEITPVIIAAVADMPAARGKQLLRELVDHNLLDQLSIRCLPGGPRYRMHDLVRLYARERAEAEESAAELTAAVDRLATSYLAIAHNADRLLRPYRSDGGDENEDREALLTFADASQARMWLTVERHNLLACIRAMNPTTQAAELSGVLAVHFRDFGFWSDVQYLYGEALAICRHVGDRHGEVDALWALGELERLIGKGSEAREYHAQALTLARQLGYQRAEADTLRELGHLERFLGDYGQARQHHAHALTLARQLGYKRAEADTLWGLGELERFIGDYGLAREYHAQALTVAQQLGYRRVEVDALWGLGEVERLVGQYGSARDCYTQALMLARDIDYRRAEVDSLWGLGQIERLVGEYGSARDYYAQALALARQLSYRRIEVDALWGLGEVERLVGQYAQAREYHTQALALARDVGYRRAEAEALRGLGQVERLVGQYAQAREYHIRALTLARRLHDRRVEVDALRSVGEVERLVGQYGAARECYTAALSLARELGYRFGEVLTLGGVGQLERLVGDYGKAREYQTQALNLARQLGDRRAEAEALRSLGEVERLLEAYDQARKHYTHALTLARQLGYKRAEVDALWGVGEVERLVGEYDHAREYHTQALTLARQLGYRPGEVLGLWGLGEVERLDGEYHQAHEYYRQGLDLAQHLGDRRAEAEALWGMGHVTSDAAIASKLQAKALDIYEELGVSSKTVRLAIRQLNC